MPVSHVPLPEGRLPTRYSVETRWLHWLTALMVLVQFALGETWGFLPRGTVVRVGMIMTHTSVGVLLAATFLTRIVWAVTGGRAIRFPVRNLSDQVARLVHWLLYVMLGAEIAVGYMLRWSRGRPVMAFGVPINSPFADMGVGVQRIFGQCHYWLAWGLIMVAACHAMAALYHAIICRDGVLQRMLPARG
ncbi:cytochrome b [Novacetimonas hansenii]|uniref:Cytochrome b n=1 Tax=Novacetimonas hansenii TaxID=436 RepID=A0AAW5EQS4_NOVHA|nr:cytochrome b [Novacetimonas hansenii]MBL7237634.1 cytochrome b [Novacetimonas hansenii]MCJ8353218.1 cytochrome b [Novacetimonas hansenii]PYD73081.1 cytochrome b [Novacetimonas hansenii]QOF95855.1 cytochrome b [Novacetimonas hansenii]RFO99261.1 cytochrome B [Novacetimonas hansenii]